MAPRPMAQPRSAGYAQPFGQAYAAPQPGQIRFLGFGITFMVIYVLAGIVLLWVGSMLSKAAAELGPEMKTAGTIFTGVGLVMLLFGIICGVLCIMGQIAGVYIGMGLVILNLLGSLASFTSKSASGSTGGTVIGVFLNVVLLLLAIMEIKRNAAHKAQISGSMGYPLQGLPRPRLRRGPALPQPAYGNAYAQVAPPPMVAAPQPVYEIEESPPPASGSAPTTSPRTATLWMLALAASLEPDFSMPRLERARTAARRLLGDKGETEIGQWLSNRLDTADPSAQMRQLAPLIANNPKLAESLRKCVAFVLKEGGTFTPAGQQFFAQFEADCMGGAAPAPAPAKPRGIQPRRGGAAPDEM